MKNEKETASPAPQGGLSGYIRKFKGLNAPRPPRVRTNYIFWSWLASFIGILVVASITLRSGIPMMIGSFGASAVLLYSALEGPLSQPRNLLGGHLVSAIIGVTMYQLFGRDEITLALAVSLSIVTMLWTRTLHPPGGATALIAVDTKQDFLFIFSPVLAGACVLLIVALLVNNLSEDRQYPRYWL